MHCAAAGLLLGSPLTLAMNEFLPIGKYSFGMGDRFARQAQAQLQACLRAARQGADIVPVWNKSNREHNIVHSEPTSVRAEADGYASGGAAV